MRRLFVALLATAQAVLAASGLTVPLIRQAKNGCGAASVAMITQYWNPQSSAPPEQIYQRLYDKERGGILLADMKKWLTEAGYNAVTFRGQRADLEQHLQKGRPLIVGLRSGARKQMHFVVVSGIEGDHLLVNDPTKAKPRRLTAAQFDREWGLGDRWILLATPR